MQLRSEEASELGMEAVMIVYRIIGFLGPVFLSAGLISVSAVAEGSNPTSSERAILVLDASGSMWGQIDGTPKITIARDVIQGLLQDWSPEVELGLTAYGHRQKGNCGDIETLAPVGPVDAQNIMTAIETLNPKGKTPLTAAVRQAAEALKYTEDKATVILVSDGEETCDLNPCEIGRALESTGVDFTAHIISFDVPEEKTAGLRCLANETGGVFLEASNANELKDAMAATKEIVSNEPPIDLGEASVDAPEDVIVAGSAFEVEWSGPQNELDHLDFVTPGGEKMHRTVHVYQDDVVSPIKMTAPEKPGTYWVHYATHRGNELARDTFTVVAAEASVDAPAEVVAGSAFEVEWSGPQNELDHLDFVTPGGGEDASHGPCIPGRCCFTDQNDCAGKAGYLLGPLRHTSRKRTCS